MYKTRAIPEHIALSDQTLGAAATGSDKNFTAWAGAAAVKPELWISDICLRTFLPLVSHNLGRNTPEI